MIFFAAMFGFGPFAGFPTLSFATVGSLAELPAEAIEETDRARTGAVEATGGGAAATLAHGIRPRVAPAFRAMAAFRRKIAIRESAALGRVCACGIGPRLQCAPDTRARHARRGAGDDDPVPDPRELPGRRAGVGEAARGDRPGARRYAQGSTGW